MGWILRIYPVFLELIRKKRKIRDVPSYILFQFKMNGHNLACFQKNTRWLIVIKHKQSARIKRKDNKLVFCFTTVMFWLLRRVCIYYPRPWNLSQFNVKMFSGNGKFSQKSLYTQMHVHISTANYWFIFAWQAKWTST